MNIPIQREFIKWYFDEPFPGPGSKRNRNRFLEEFFEIHHFSFKKACISKMLFCYQINSFQNFFYSVSSQKRKRFSF